MIHEVLPDRLMMYAKISKLVYVKHVSNSSN